MYLALVKFGTMQYLGAILLAGGLIFLFEAMYSLRALRDSYRPKVIRYKHSDGKEYVKEDVEKLKLSTTNVYEEIDSEYKKIGFSLMAIVLGFILTIV